MSSENSIQYGYYHAILVLWHGGTAVQVIKIDNNYTSITKL